MSTFQQLINQARLLMNDDDKDRFDDADAMAAANDFMLLTKRHRPDAYFGSDRQPISAGPYVLANTFPLDQQLELACKDYIIARSHAVDDEAASDGKLQAFTQSSNAQAGR